MFILQTLPDGGLRLVGRGGYLPGRLPHSGLQLAAGPPWARPNLEPHHLVQRRGRRGYAEE